MFFARALNMYNHHEYSPGSLLNSLNVSTNPASIYLSNPARSSGVKPAFFSLQ